MKSIRFGMLDVRDRMVSLNHRWLYLLLAFYTDYFYSILQIQLIITIIIQIDLVIILHIDLVIFIHTLDIDLLIIIVISNIRLAMIIMIVVVILIEMWIVG